MITIYFGSGAHYFTYKHDDICLKKKGLFAFKENNT